MLFAGHNNKVKKNTFDCNKYCLNKKIIILIKLHDKFPKRHLKLFVHPSTMRAKSLSHFQKC